MKQIIVGAREPQTLARFWAAALGATASRDVGGFGGFLVTPGADGGAPMLFTQIGESETPPVWPDLLLSSAEGTIAGHIRALQDLGADILRDGLLGPMVLDGLGSVVMADPEGNEFTVESTDAERDEVIRALDAGREVDTSHSYFAGRLPDPRFMSTARAEIRHQ